MASIVERDCDPTLRTLAMKHCQEEKAEHRDSDENAQRFWPQILKLYQEPFRQAMQEMMKDWLTVFLALLELVTLEQKPVVLDAYLRYFISLADIEEQSSFCVGVQSVEYTDMKLVVQNEAKAMFGSVKQDMNSGLRFSTVSEKNNAEQIGKIMSQWTLGACAMSADVRNKHADYFRPHISRARKLLAEETGLCDNIPVAIPWFGVNSDIVGQLATYQSKPRSRPFRLNI
ncbi:hypothetical protein B0H14DRAFT_2588583 [Mycena olivaceomarginata]|nr:hypothetical protein B0H14DRAFT_2588583 [Mycena olivaceomarginata]